MTHEELMTKIDDWIYTDGISGLRTSSSFAIRAIAELHKPWPGGCSHCINIEGGYMSYPCPTIQAIEKELK